MGKLKRFETRVVKGWQGLTAKEHLSHIFRSAPQKASLMMVKLLSYNRGGSLESFLSQFPTKEFESNTEYYWDIVSSSRRNIPLIEARDEDGNVVVAGRATNVGAHTAPFYLVFGEDWFGDGEVIFGNLNNKYPFRILGEARMEGMNAVYKVELMGANTSGVPAERLLAGERFSVSYAPVENTLSRKVGTVRHEAPTKMYNEFSTIRIKHKVEGLEMLDDTMQVGLPIVKVVNGKETVKVIDRWMHYEDWRVEEEFSDYKNNLLAFATSNRNEKGEYLNIGKSGEVIRMGSGIFEQMEAANVIYYNAFGGNFPLSVLEDALDELYDAKLGKTYKQKIVIKTGRKGASQFSKAIANEISGWKTFTIEGKGLVVDKVSSDYHENALKAGYLFTEYIAPNGITISVDVDPMYDDVVANKIMHPNGGVAMSYRYDIMMLGTMDQPNICKCVCKRRPEVRSYQWNFYNGFTGEMNNNSASFDEDATVIHKMATLGALVLDPTRTISIIPNVLM